MGNDRDQGPGGDVVRVRPGRDALNWLWGTVNRLKGADRCAPVTVVVSNYVVGRVVLRHLADSGGCVNVRTMLLDELATSLESAPPQPDQVLDDIIEGAAVRAALREAGGPLRALEHHLSLQNDLVRLFRDLRREEVDVERLLDSESNRMAAAALRTYLDFQRQIAGYRDPTLRRATAVTRLETERTPPEELRELGPLIVFLPTELDPVDTRLLHAAARWVPVVTASAQVPDATASGSDRAELRVIRALDPTEEVRQVLREIVADLEREVALHRTAILYRQVDPYARLLRESLAAAELPWFGLGGKRLADSQPARLLLGVLGLPERAFAREAVLGWLDAQPAIDSDIPPFAWDRLSRAADIVRGADQWQARLLAFADQQAAEADRRPGESTTSLRNFLEQQANLARRMAAVIEQLASSLRAPPDGSPWTAFVEWAEGVRTQLATPRGGWPADHHAEAEAVRLRLAQLTRADQFDTGGVTLETFVAALDAALQSRSLPEGRLGNGVVIGPIESAAGLTFDRVYIVGLTEGAFPPTLVADPFFRGGHPLDRRPRRREAERAAFLAALAGADGGRLTVSAPDSVGGRAAFASHWLLELAQHEWRPSGGQLDAAAFRRLNETEAPWLRIVDSPRDGIQRSPAADLEGLSAGGGRGLASPGPASVRTSPCCQSGPRDWSGTATRRRASE